MAAAGCKDAVVDWTDSEGEAGQVPCAKCGGWRPSDGSCARCVKKGKKRKSALKIQPGPGAATKAERRKAAGIRLHELLRQIEEMNKGGTVMEIRRALALADAAGLGD